MDPEKLKQGIAAYESHILHVAEVFNKWAAHHALGVRMNPANAIASLKNGTAVARVSSFWVRADDTGVIHDTQIKTVVDCLAELKKETPRWGHVVGAMQSGKTTAALGLLWAGPVLYLLNGKSVYPFHVISNQTTHENQTQIELDAFLNYYADMEFERDEPIPAGVALNPIFQMSPSLSTYRKTVLQGGDSLFEVPQLEDLYRRVGGARSIQKFVDLCNHAREQGHKPLMIIDEPQYGASDRFVETEEGTEQRKCVLEQILASIETAMGSTRNDHWFIGLSATPFEMNDVRRIWEVRQDLTEEYSGFNFFNGKPIAEGVDIRPPEVMSLTAFADWADTPFLSEVHMSVYDFAKPKAFDQYVKKTGYGKTQSEYRRDVEDALRTGIYKILDKHAGDAVPAGLCFRALNNNDKTDALIAGLKLDENKVEVIRYYDKETTGISVKRVIAHRKRADLPYIIFVTSRARMADAFPTSTRFFMDLAEKASDLNALFQGLLGRACGYGKKSTVVLSDVNAGVVKDYVATKGKYVLRPSRHTVTVGNMRRGAPSGMIKLRRGMKDPVVQEFFRRLDEEVVQKMLGPSIKARVPRMKGGEPRRAPILRIADELALFDHLEEPEVRMEVFPQIHTPFHIARSNEAVRHTSRAGVMLRYSLDEEGNCRYHFRSGAEGDSAQGGATGRAMGKRDSEQHMEPTIYIERFDSASGESINDPEVAGPWRAVMVTFPLTEPVRELRAAEVAYPVQHSPFNDFMDPDEQERRDTVK